jgi:hypothetical protein
MKSYEQLGAFYLGGVVQEDGSASAAAPLLYDMKDLTTHGLCVGMTGSGKTGLAVALLEEAAIDGIPVLAIDPKGDLGNLLLTFPELRPSDFAPWVPTGVAGTDSEAIQEEARRTADLWRKGLADWDQEPERIGRFAEAVDRAIYTGRPLSVLRSFSAPAPGADEETLRDRVSSAVSGLLGLIGIDADPLRSREHILLSALLDRAWREGRDVDIAELIRQVQKPPFERLGVLELEGFFPSKDRFELALGLNNLLASPGFAAWMEGEPLDVQRLLYTAEGKPRLSIISIAHLSDAERMFVVTLVLSELLAWVRSQPGSRTLRALLYMDEVFGYFPPSANPPSKIPMLTLLKQARAYGLGCVLATQNPVDLDYKGLSNCGTWFLGRLQTERDKARVLDGLETASGGGLDRRRIDELLSGLPKRTFIMHNVHEDEPVVFRTRWVLSYLAGPLTREQIRLLEGARSDAAAATPPAPSVEPEREPAPGGERPALPGEVIERFLPPTQGVGEHEHLVYRPALMARAIVHYANAPAAVDHWDHVAYVTSLPDDGRTNPWDEAQLLGVALPELETAPEARARFRDLPAAASSAKSYPRWSKMLESEIYRERPLRLWRSRKPKLVSRVGEDEGAFRGRVRDALREQRDAGLEKLRRRYTPKLARLQDQIRTAEGRVEREESQYRSQKTQTAISIGATIVGALFGRKLGSVGNVGRAASAARGASRAGREKLDIERAQEKVEALQQKLDELEAQFEDDAEALREPIDPDEVEIEEVRVAPRKADLDVEQLVLAWLPWRVDRDGFAEPAHSPLGRSPAQ